MNTSPIEWTDRTWNPVSGCSHVSEGCRNCYAERVFPRVYSRQDRVFTDVHCHPYRLDQPLKIKKPQNIFVNSMSDLFHEDVPDAFIFSVFRVMAKSQRHTFQILTKRPEAMNKFCRRISYIEPGFNGHDFGTCSYWPNDPFEYPINNKPLPNVWLGVSVEDQPTADERIPLLLDTPAAVRWVSAEPLLGPVDFKNLQDVGFDALYGVDEGRKKIDWVVVGGESGPRARVMEEVWAFTIMEQCRMAGVPFFMKQLSQKTLRSGFKDIHNFPEYLRVRAFPKEPTP